MKVHAREELGIDTEELSRPWTAAWTSAVAFSCGGAFPLLAGAFITDPSIRVWAIGGVTTLALAVSGALGAILGGAPWKWASLRVVLGGWVAMLMTFGIGKAFGVYGMELELD